MKNVRKFIAFKIIIKNRRKYPSAGKCMPSALVDIASLKGATFQVNGIISCDPVTNYIISYIFLVFKHIFYTIEKYTTSNCAVICERNHKTSRVRGAQRCPMLGYIDTKS